MYKKIAYSILGLLLIADLYYSYQQYSFTAIDGDLPEIYLGTRGYDRVLKDPLGIAALKGEVYAAPNRYTAHLVTVQYFYWVPMLLRIFMTPIDAFYTSIALIKILCHAGLLFLISWYVSRLRPFGKESMLLTACILTPLFLAGDFYTEFLGIIDFSVIYVIFYALPVICTLIFFMPFYRYYLTGKFVGSRWKYYAFILYSIPLAFFGPLTPPVLVVGLSVIIGIPVFLSFFKHNGDFRNRVKAAFSSLPKEMYVIAIITIVFCLYSLYIGRNNVENLWGEPKSLRERFVLMKQGLYECFMLPALGVLQILFAIGVNFFLVNFLYGKKLKKYYYLVAGLILFAALYLTLMPFGGYRFYRPLILKRDTMLPITIIFLFLLSSSSVFILYKLKNWRLGIYCVLTIALLHHYSSVDNISII